jgi:hypothetical protein
VAERFLEVGCSLITSLGAAYRKMSVILKTLPKYNDEHINFGGFPCIEAGKDGIERSRAKL